MHRNRTINQRNGGNQMTETGGFTITEERASLSTERLFLDAYLHHVSYSNGRTSRYVSMTEVRQMPTYPILWFKPCSDITPGDRSHRPSRTGRSIPRMQLSRHTRQTAVPGRSAYQRLPTRASQEIHEPISQWRRTAATLQTGNKATYRLQRAEHPVIYHSTQGFRQLL